jgi:hypothetical protein
MAVRMTLAGSVRSVPELISPAVRLRDSWLASREERGRDVCQDGAGLRAGDDVDSAAGFARWAGRLAGIATWLRLASSRRPAACSRTCARPNSASPAVLDHAMNPECCGRPRVT